MKIQAWAARHRWTFATISAIFTVIYALTGTAISAELYQWQDENGVVHFTDKPPAGKDATKRFVKTPPTSGDEPNEEVTEEKDAEAERCDTERKRLQVLQSNMTVRMRNDDGSLRELSKTEMEEEIAISQAAIQRLCKPDTDAQ